MTSSVLPWLIRVVGPTLMKKLPVEEDTKALADLSLDQERLDCSEELAVVTILQLCQ